MYQKVNYQTNSQEDPNIYHARSDAAQSWVFLNAYEQDADSKFFGDGSQAGSPNDDKQQFKQFYIQALNEAGNIQ